MHNNTSLVQAVTRALCLRRGVSPGAAAGAGVLLAISSGVAAAQEVASGAETSADQVQEVVVTGIRASIANAVEMKMRSDDMIEAISAEDLGKLPDLSIADSLARLPGLAAQRTDGRSNYISIRGFAADFSGTTLEGREQASTGENRGMEFDQYPAELINAVQVYKTPDASLIGQGLAGTVNLQTIKPLSANGLKLAVNVRGERNSNNDLNPGQGVGSWGNRVSLSVVDQFLDHTLGVAFGVARLDSPIQEKQYKAWWWGINNGPGSLSQSGDPPPVPGDPDLALSQEGMQVRARSESSVRTGVMGVIEWAPTQEYHSELDLFFSKFDDEAFTNGVQWSSSPWDGIRYPSARTSPLSGMSVLTGGTIDGVKPIDQNDYTNTTTRSFSAGWNHRLQLGGWTLTGDLSYSNAKDDVHDAYTFTGPASVSLNGVGFLIPTSGGYPTFTVPANLADPGQVGFTDPTNYSYDGRVEHDHQTDTIRAVRIGVKHPLGWIFKDIDLGFDYSDRKKVKSAFVQFAYLNGNGCSTSNAPECAAAPYNNAMYTPVNPGLLHRPTSLGYAGIPGVLNYNVLAALASQFYLVQDMGANDYNRNYSVEEKVPLGYLKLDIDTAMGGVAIRGNAGVQFVHTNQSSTALLTDDTGQPSGTYSGGAAYNVTLPSLNLVGDLGNRNLIRLGVAKSMMRGRIDDEKAASSASVSSSDTGPAQWSGSGGNPELRPYIALGEDISYEKVFGRASYLSLALFNKNLTTYIYNQTTLFDFTGFPTPREADSPIGPWTKPLNGSGGKIQGYEIALVLEGNLFADALDGFGMQSSFAYTNNYVPPTALGNVPGSPTTFPGLSKKVAAVTLYYEKHGASIRIAETYRSAFTGEITADFDQLGYTQIAEDKTTNLQAGYEWTGGPLKGLSVLLQINNLTDSPYRSTQMTTLPGGTTFAAPLEYDTFGRQYLLGFNYKL